jgi:hypothetical protein
MLPGVRFTLSPPHAVSVDIPATIAAIRNLLVILLLFKKMLEKILYQINEPK